MVVTGLPIDMFSTPGSSTESFAVNSLRMLLPLSSISATDHLKLALAPPGCPFAVAVAFTCSALICNIPPKRVISATPFPDELVTAVTFEFGATLVLEFMRPKFKTGSKLSRFRSTDATLLPPFAAGG